MVVIGGGTGTYVVLSGLKKYPFNLSAVVSMLDSGGSTGRLRDQLGVLPPGDIRQALVALSEESAIWRNLFTYRFDNGDLNGHSFGNIFLSTLEKMTGSLPDAITLSQKLLNTKGNVYPVTLTKTSLCVELSGGKEVIGESNIDELGTNWNEEPKVIKRAFLLHKAYPSQNVLDNIKKADYIIIGPGDLYTSIIPNFLIEGIAKSVSQSKAKKIYVLNLMTKRGQTDGFTALDHLNTLEKYISKGVFDYVIVNSGKINRNVEEWYKKTCEVETVINDLKNSSKLKVITDHLVSEAKFEKTIQDRIQRSLIRHDPEKLARCLASVMLEQGSFGFII